jgi:hypothetical protein
MKSDGENLCTKIVELDQMKKLCISKKIISNHIRAQIIDTMFISNEPKEFSYLHMNSEGKQSLYKNYRPRQYQIIDTMFISN